MEIENGNKPIKGNILDNWKCFLDMSDQSAWRLSTKVWQRGRYTGKWYWHGNVEMGKQWPPNTYARLVLSLCHQIGDVSIELASPWGQDGKDCILTYIQDIKESSVDFPSSLSSSTCPSIIIFTGRLCRNIFSKMFVPLLLIDCIRLFSYWTVAIQVRQLTFSSLLYYFFFTMLSKVKIIFVYVSLMAHDSHPYMDTPL